MAPIRQANYYEIHRRVSQTNAICAMAIWFATAAVVWGDGRRLAIVFIGQAVTVAFNVWGDLRGIQRIGPRFDLVRALVNMVVTVGVAWSTDWPAPVWLWPPYTALAFDRAGSFSIVNVLLSLTVQNLVALIDGVSWIYPLSSVILTTFAWRVSDLRVRAIRDMLDRSDQQRSELERAHAGTQAALAQLRAEIAARERVELELRAAQKLEALGRIASGVAHEINTPIQFVGDSVMFLQTGVEDVLSLCRLNGTVRSAIDDATRERAIAAADVAEADADLPYLVENLPQALARARDGLERVALIVRSMKQFAHHESVGRAHTDLNQAIQATLAISCHEYKLVADIVTELGDVPPVLCNAGEINQVLLNIVVNAAHAIESAVGKSARRGTIRITTTRDHDDVVISIGDTGTGIPAAVREHVFDPFFTTKAIGRGTGQGLAIARTIVESHHGRLTFETELGRGTEFHIRLPIDDRELAAMVS